MTDFKAYRTDLIVLGLLAQRPRHGYELKTLLSSEFAPLLDVTPSTLYYSLKRLESEHLIQPQGTERVGGRPARTSFELTPAGREHLRQLLRHSFQDLAYPHQIPLALAFGERIDREALVLHLAQRQQTLETTRALLENGLPDAIEGAEDDCLAARAIADYWLRYCAMEAAWIGDFIRGIGPQTNGTVHEDVHHIEAHAGDAASRILSLVSLIRQMPPATPAR